jgi:hypothetical protein
MDYIHRSLGIKEIHKNLHRFILESMIKRITSFERYMN